MTLCRYSGSFSYIPQQSVGWTENLNSVSFTIGAVKFSVLFFQSQLGGFLSVSHVFFPGDSQRFRQNLQAEYRAPPPGLIPF